MLTAAFLPASRPCAAKDDQAGTPIRIERTQWNWDFRLLEHSKRQIAEKDADFLAAYGKLLEEAEPYLTSELQTVTAKKLVPPSGDKHDYMSIGAYWWPDPKKPDGLPYIRRDGYPNPANSQGLDWQRLAILASAVRILALSYYFSGDEKYAERASLQLRTWFLDEATRMNPHLNYGQAIPGRTAGRSYGIIDTTHLLRVLDGVMLTGHGAELPAPCLPRGRGTSRRGDCVSRPAGGRRQNSSI